MSTQLYNNAIAAMMGIQPIKSDKANCYYYKTPAMLWHEDIPDYHCDWNALMGAVQRINRRDHVTILDNECKIHALVDGEFETINVTEGSSLISAIYDAVVKYAQWYNSKPHTYDD